MSTKVHLHLHIADLAKSRDFCQRFFGSAPVKVRRESVEFLR